MTVLSLIDRKRTSHCLMLLLLVLNLSRGTAAASEVGEMGPGFQLPILGRTDQVAMSDLKGQVVFLDFWASWCGPCRESLPVYEALYQQFGSKEFQVVAINLDEFKKDAEGFLNQHPVSYTVLLDPAGISASAWQIKAMPSSFLLDRQGRIVRSYAGFESSDIQRLKNDIEAEID
jgi:thiol-disulfide isomerase/thioredoxin